MSGETASAEIGRTESTSDPMGGVRTVGVWILGTIALAVLVRLLRRTRSVVAS
ncbi:hypothetical protein [Halomicrococcus sp. SG-WS-1]|uniref:hypothetical protein n=1 Tax=Halomicrococcus sp. SG-WS-1 TaxID=3439057 RepID=UPI003F795775